jgi:Xaa-Pro aminopeptidase
MTRTRLDKLTASLSTSGLDAVILNPGPTLTYLSGVQFHLMERPIVLFVAPGHDPALVLPEPSAFDVDAFVRFLCEQDDLGPKQWPRYVRIASALPRTETFKVLKRQLTAEALDCADQIFRIPR